MWLVVEVNDKAFAIWGAADNMFEIEGLTFKAMRCGMDQIAGLA
jgi:hypothetical protein